MKNRKIAAIALIIAITLSIFGFAYAHWSDMVYIEGTVKMGSLTIVWDETELLGYVDNEPLLPVPKDVAWGDIYYDLDPANYVVDPHTGKGGYKVIILEVHNAYPQYVIAFNTLTVNNTGTIPAHFTDLVITGFDETDGAALVFEWKPGFEYEEGAFWDDVDGDGILEEIINVSVVNFVCHQLDPCHVTKGEIDLEFKQEAEECHTYTFDVTIEAIQWNKYP